MQQFIRILRMGGQNIFRNSFLSFSSIFISTIVLFMVGVFIFVYIALNDAIDIVKEKVDITVYFVRDTPEAQVIEIDKSLNKLSTVKEAVFTSEIEALEEYRTRHINDLELLEGLSILGENPFRARISVKAKNNKNLSAIASFLENLDTISDNELLIIDEIDYNQNESVINQLLKIIDIVIIGSTSVGILLLFISFLIIYMTIRLVISSSAKEIQVMELMGASNSYIRGPFIVSGIVYSLTGAFISIILIYPTIIWVEGVLHRILSTTGDIIIFSTQEIIWSLFFIILIGIVVGALSSFLSTAKYLK